MTRIAPLCLLLALALSACYPQSGSFTPLDPADSDPCAGVDADGDGSFVYPLGCNEQPPLDCDDEDPLLRAEEGCSHGNADLVVPSCFDGVYTMFMVFDFSSGTSDYESGYAVLFSDGTWTVTENGWVEAEPRDPTIFMIVDLATDQVVAPESVFLAVDVLLLDEGYEQIGELAPNLEFVGDFVQYDCPSG